MMFGWGSKEKANGTSVGDALTIGAQLPDFCLKLAISLTLVMPVTACAPSSEVAAVSAQPASMETEVDSIVESVLEAGNYPGVAVAVMQEGELVAAKGYGLANVETGEKVAADTIFPIGSITKSFTGLAVAQLAAEGDIDLDASIADYIDELPVGWEAIRVRNLMNHTAGIFNYTEDQTIQAAPGKDRSFAEMRALWEKHPLRFEPGSRWHYSNSGYFLLGMIIEKASGLSYGDYVSRHIIEPLGLERTSYPTSVEGKPGAGGYVFTEGQQKPMPDWSPSVPYSAGAILSTVGDVAKYIDAVHHSGKVSEEVREILYTQDIAGGEVMTYALGGLSIQPIEGRLRLSHPGSIWGYQSFFAYYPEERIAVVVLTNSHKAPIHPSNIERKLERLALGQPQPAYADAALSDEVSSAVSGDYSTGAVEFISSNIGFEDRGGVIHLVFGGLKNEMFSVPLRYVGDGLFVAYHDDEMTVRFDSVSGQAALAEVTMYGGKLQARR